MKNKTKSCGWLFLIGGMLVICLALGIQLVPYGRNHTNPAVLAEPNWDSPQTKQLAQRACFDCHSNETVWTWYSNIAPVSWLIVHDVEEGRSRLNFSEWNHLQGEGIEEAGEVIMEGEMPPAQYLLLHPNATLSSTEKEQLVRGLEATMRR